ncbi:unnamed protein product [Lymnaea stagnalis]|uniref:Secreted protein n=1 Tax=Lymnaea stagnalis TaxID=6523 RepID=A0AAV2ISY8_LYMST
MKMISLREIWMFQLFFVFNYLSTVLCRGHYSDRVIQTLEDEIGAENFTYYRLQRTGTLRLELRSLMGDVDVYISGEVQHPDYITYDLKSETCGLDVISIPSAMSRPVYISLFGHPNYLHSKYRLTILEVDDPVVDDYEILVDKYERYYYEEMEGGSPNEESYEERASKSSGDGHSFQERVEDDLPMWWKLLLGILEFGIEVIL